MTPGSVTALLVAGDPVGVPALAVLMIGYILFLLALGAARRRRGRPARAAAAAPRSWAGVAVQGLAIGIVAAGNPRILLDPLSLRAIVQALLVATLLGGAIWLFFAASRTMGSNWSLVARLRPDHSLVTNGPFAHVRHPIYVALFALLLAVAIGCGHGARLIVAVPLYALGTTMRVRHEERLLRAMFGTAYDAYAARVARFVPGIF